MFIIQLSLISHLNLWYVRSYPFPSRRSADQATQLATQFQDFENAKAFLRKTDANGRTLYDHITNVILDVVREKPENALEAFESISVRVKKATTDPTVYKEIPPIPEQSEEHKRLKESVDTTLHLISPVVDEDADIPEPVLIPDLVAEAQLLEWAGVKIGQEEMYKIYLSIQQFATDNSVRDVRFVGKIFGTRADYYILEGRPDEYPESSEDAPNLEPFGVGCNELVYYAANSAEEKWVQLPQLRPEWVTIARQTRRFFTGDLNAPVLGFPRFPANEAAYLRTQIARITAAAWVAPKGYYTPDDGGEEGSVRHDENFQPLPVSDLLAPENWEHSRAGILKQGRVTPYVAERNDDEEEEGVENPDEQEQPLPRLASLAEDNHGFGPLSTALEQTGSWTFSAQPGEANPYAVAVATSLAWPGAVTVAKDRMVVSFYVGYGTKYLMDTYTPPPPPTIQHEYQAEFSPADGEEDPMHEQADPEPPKNADEDEEGEEDLGDDDEEYLHEDNE